MKAPTIALDAPGYVKYGLFSLGAAGFCLLLAGCSIAGGGNGSTPSVLDRDVASTTSKWDLAVEAIAQPVVTDGTALVYANDDNGLNDMYTQTGDVVVITEKLTVVTDAEGRFSVNLPLPASLVPQQRVDIYAEASAPAANGSPLAMTPVSVQ